MELYKGQVGSPITYLTSDISAAQTTISVADDSALPDAPNICTIGFGENLETIKYETKSNGVLQNVTRGIEGTPQSWQAGTEVARFFTAYDHLAIIEEIESVKVDGISLNEALKPIDISGEFTNLTSGSVTVIAYYISALKMVYVNFNATGSTFTGSSTTEILSISNEYNPDGRINFSMLSPSVSGQGTVQNGTVSVYPHSTTSIARGQVIWFV